MPKRPPDPRAAAWREVEAEVAELRAEARELREKLEAKLAALHTLDVATCWHAPGAHGLVCPFLNVREGDCDHPSGPHLAVEDDATIPAPEWCPLRERSTLVRLRGKLPTLA